MRIPMRRRVSDMRALCQGARRPARRVVLGAGLLLPAGVLMAGGHPAIMTGSDLVATSERDVLAEAWRERVMERQRDATIEAFARRFEIPTDLAVNIHDAAVAERIEPEIAFGLVRAESSFRARAVSPVGAVGLTQLLPSTARWLVPGTSRSDLLRPETNLQIGFRYLRRLIDQYDGDEELALTAYNRGPGTVARLLRVGRDPDNGYAAKVMTGESALHVRLMNAKFRPSSRRRS